MFAAAAEEPGMAQTKSEDTRCPITGAPNLNPNGNGWDKLTSTYILTLWGSSFGAQEIVIHDARVMLVLGGH